ncbi:hypothetical protein [Photobacterium nomapromontoriensis]|uniref:hypothetical protein n=1 Tax=Photobacterium nomapromontoriensis TaxID=2910237 RepID=UPI003D0DEBFC
MRLSRRGWNNVIIIGVVCFIAVIQLPELVKNRFASQDAPAASDAALTRLLPEGAKPVRMVLPEAELSRQSLGWQAVPALSVPAHTLIGHWQTLAGTPVSHDMMTKLKPQLTTPRTVEIWLADHEEPVRVTVYALPQFWLLNNWQGDWFALSVDEAYLFPPTSNQK